MLRLVLESPRSTQVLHCAMDSWVALSVTQAVLTKLAVAPVSNKAARTGKKPLAQPSSVMAE